MSNEVSLNVKRLGVGQGPALLMLHGWGQSHEALLALGELLAQSMDVHLIDLPGFGNSGELPSVWGTEDYARRILSYMDQENISRGYFLGHSYGGRVSMKVACLQPERVERLVLIASSGLRPKRSLKKRIRMKWIALLRKTIRILDRAFTRRLYEKWFIPRYASVDYKSAAELRQTFVRIVNEDLSSELPKIKASTLLLWGEMDSETPLEMAHRIKALIPRSRLVALPGKGHEPFVDTGAQLCAYHILPFLNDSEQGKETKEANRHA